MTYGYQETVHLFGYDWDVEFDWDITGSHVEHRGWLGMKETVLDDWTMDIITINGAPVSCFTPTFVAKVIDAIENDTDFLQCRAERHSMDWYGDEADHAYETKRDRRMEATNA